MKESDEDFTQLQTLLRLKRYETPPTGSAEMFLYEFHRRQRAELVRRPLWRIALDRLENFLPMPVLATPRFAYAGAAAAALSLAAVGALSRGSAVVSSNSGGAVAQISAPAVAAESGATTPAARRAPMDLAPGSAAMHFVDADIDIENDARFSTVPPRVNSVPATTRRDSNSLRPRYVLESQPVRYEPRSSTF